MQLSRLFRGARLAAIALASLVAAQAHADPPAPSGADSTPPEGSTPSRPSTSPIDVRASSEISAYGDTDHVYVVTPTIAGTVSNPTAGWSLDGRYLVDVVSAASVDIVSTASRRWEEIRQAGTLNAAYKPGTLGVAAMGDVSSEPDYLSWTAGAAVTQDIFDKNATWLLGYSHGRDVAGRTGTPFSVFSRTVNRDAVKGGLTLILDRATVATVVGDVDIENGDPSKPYRYIPLFAPGQAVPRGASPAFVSSVRVSERPLEQLPLSRDRFAISGRIARRWKSSTLRLDERLYADSWGLKATSTDGRYLVDLGRFEVGPHVRVHAQSQVDFWQRAYVIGPGYNYPALRTGDRELGPLVNFTLGGSARMRLGSPGNPRAWILGLDLNAMSTQYLDDLYINQRFSFIGALSLEGQL